MDLTVLRLLWALSGMENSGFGKEIITHKGKRRNILI